MILFFIAAKYLRLTVSDSNADPLAKVSCYYTEKVTKEGVCWLVTITYCSGLFGKITSQITARNTSTTVLHNC